MLKPLGYQLSNLRVLLAVMVGYLANLFFPRMGEVTRCGVLNRTDNVNMAESIGTVVAERIVDLISLLLITVLTLVLETDLLGSYFHDIFLSKFSSFGENLIGIYLIAGGFFAFLVLVYFIIRANKERLKRSKLFLKIRSILRQLVDGITSIRKLKNLPLFIFLSVSMWAIYFLMSYVVIFSVKETSGLGLIAGLSILVTGSIGMATPVQGGIGAFHALVSGVLVLYGIVLEDGLLYATVLHSSQLLAVLFYGLISLIITFTLERQNVNKPENSK